MKILITGLGSIGARHARLINELYPDIQILAYRSNNAKIKENIDYIKNIYDIVEAFSYKPDVVFISNPTSMHIEMAMLAAEHGCNFFMEKPLSNNLNQVEQLIHLTNRKNLITLMGCNMRFNPIVAKIKKYVDDGTFGRAISFSISCGSYLPEWRPWQDYSKSYSSSKSLGGGVVLDLIHEIDYAKWIFDDFVIIKSLTDKVSNLNIETEDYADIIVKTNKNIVGNIHLDYYRRFAKREIEVVFENHVVIGDLINNTLSIINKEGKEVIDFNFERDYMYREQIKYFFACIINGKKTFNDIEEGYKVLKIALKIKDNMEI